MAESAEQTLALHHYLGVVRRRKWLILAAAILVPLAAVIVSSLQSPVYEGSAKVLLQRQNLASRLTGIPEASASVETETLVNTQAEVARVTAIARAVVEDLGLEMTPEEFLASSSVSASPEAEILTFNVRDGDQRLAARAATVYAQQYSRYRRDQDTASIVSAREGVERHIRELEESGGASGRLYDSLLNREQQLQTMATLQTSNTTVIEAAGDAEQVSPKPVRNAVLGLVVGAAVGLGLAFLLEALDTRIRTARELETQLGIPLLARVPPWPEGGDGDGSLAMIADPEGGQAEAFRMLRTNVEFTLLDRDASSIMVTSALEEEGKSTTVANLALAFAQAGKRVAVVDLDLRRPRLDRLFGLDQGPGVVQVVLGERELAEAINVVPITPEKGNAAPAPASGNGTGGTLEVLTCGSLPPNPGEFVASHRLPEMLGQLAERADLVLVDSPPLLHVGDAMTLSADVDAVVVVARQKRLRQGNVQETDRLLSSMRAHKLGFVLTGVDHGKGYGYGYGYRRHQMQAEREGQFVA
jgi:Mrp family chromosome partitioning ATPase/capsular polysaccharide biosynthesis protein